MNVMSTYIYECNKNEIQILLELCVTSNQTGSALVSFRALGKGFKRPKIWNLQLQSNIVLQPWNQIDRAGL